MALLEKLGFGQVEPNRISGIKAGKVVADVPMNVADMKKLDNALENGRFVAIRFGAGIEGNLKKGELGLPKAEEVSVGLVYSEVKLYSEYTSNKDFALFTHNPTINQIRQTPYYDKAEVAHETVVPRVLGLTVNDVFTINLVEGKMDSLAIGDVLSPNTDGVLAKNGTIEQIKVKIVAKTTMADGQPAIKVAVIEA